MYTHKQQSREIALEEKYGAMPQHPGIINIYMSTAIYYMNTMAQIRNFITMQFPLIILTALIGSKEFGFHYTLQLKKLGKQ